MSLTKDGFYNIEGQTFEVIRGVEGDCLTLGDEDGGTRISGPKPWGGGQVVKTFVTCEKYGPIERLEAENAKLRELMSEGIEVGKALLRYRDNPPIKRAGPIEGSWYEMGEILSIVMDKPEFTTGELLTRLAYLMGVREEPEA